MSQHFSENIQSQIREERIRLLGEQDLLKSKLQEVNIQLEVVKLSCGHPNAIRKMMEPPIACLNPIPTVTCPDCGYSVMYLDLADPESRPRGRPSTYRKQKEEAASEQGEQND